MPFRRSDFGHRSLTLFGSLLSLSLVSVSGCIEGFDSATGADKAYYRLMDYRVDRPRVVGLRYSPQVFTGGDDVTFEALAMTPTRQKDVSVEWWGCGIDLVEPFAYYGTDCLGTSLAEYLGSGPRLTLRMPLYDLSTCEVSGCFGYIPVFAVVREPGFDPEEGYAVTWVSPDYLGTAGQAAGISDLSLADIKLKLDGTGEGDGAVTARPGQRVGLEVQMLTYETDYLFSWYVSAGNLEQLGITRASNVDLARSPMRNTLKANNMLQIPEDFSGDRISVYVVIDPISTYYSGVERFMVASINVLH